MGGWEAKRMKVCWGLMGEGIQTSMHECVVWTGATVDICTTPTVFFGFREKKLPRRPLSSGELLFAVAGTAAGFWGIAAAAATAAACAACAACPDARFLRCSMNLIWIKGASAWKKKAAAARSRDAVCVCVCVWGGGHV